MSSGFIRESDITEIRKRRQEEWEKIRKAEDPIVRPDEPYDPRSLYEKLQEQKQKKELEYEEAHKLKNMIKGLDDDEIEFLDLVDRTKIEADRKKEIEEQEELLDYRNRVAILQEKSLDEKIQTDIVINKSKSVRDQSNSQQKLLKGVVIKKDIVNKRKMNDSVNTRNSTMEWKRRRNADGTGDKPSLPRGLLTEEDISNPALKCVAILPGLGCYQDSSEEDSSSDSEEDSKASRTTDLLGRKVDRKDIPAVDNC
ncbi:hypothetical protein JTB14_011970 [Gonioctena quinquepunctata]|nr:hypothetical protein JTB14_011970 [Gonioctena quinquepunctata]